MYGIAFIGILSEKECKKCSRGLLTTVHYFTVCFRNPHVTVVSTFTILVLLLNL